MIGHVCNKIDDFPLDSFHQLGTGIGRKILIIGESPAPNGWRISGKACYRPDGKILPTGKRINELLAPLNLSVGEVGFTELSKCFVSKRSELYRCSEKCWPILLRQLQTQNYKLLIILGVGTTRIFSGLVNRTLPIGQISSIKLENRTYKVLPIYHPSPVNPVGHRNNLQIFSKVSSEISAILSSK